MICIGWHQEDPDSQHVCVMAAKKKTGQLPTGETKAPRDEPGGCGRGVKQVDLTPGPGTQGGTAPAAAGGSGGGGPTGDCAVGG